MSKVDKNKQAPGGTTPFKIPNAAKLACMGLLSGASALPNVATAGAPAYIVATDDHYVTPVNTVLASNGTTIKFLTNNDSYQGNVLANLTTCPANLSLSLAVAPMHGNVNFDQTVCTNGGSANAFGSFEYTPEDGFSGTDSFVYTLSGSNSLPDNATVSILVGNQFPISGGALGPALLIPLGAAAALARRRKKTKPV